MLIRIRIKWHLPLMSRLIYCFQVIVKIRERWNSLEYFTFEKCEVSSANILQIENMSWGKSFIYMRKRSGPKTDPVEPLLVFFSKKNQDHLGWPFGFGFISSFLRSWSIFLQQHMFFIEKLGLHARLRNIESLRNV